MSIRFALPALVCTIFAAPALSQSRQDPKIDYEIGQYEYAQLPDDGDDAVTETQTASAPSRPAARVIPVRRTGPESVFVLSPVIQPTERARAVPAIKETSTPAATAIILELSTPQPVPATYLQPYPIASFAPAPYTFPNGGARIVYPADGHQAAHAHPRAHASAPFELPPGSRLVTFDRAVWLAECRSRLAGYAPEDRDAAIAALGGAAAGYSPGSDSCASYLDSYLASAAAGTLAISPQYGRQYMLVPVKVLVLPAGVRQQE